VDRSKEAQFTFSKGTNIMAQNIHQVFSGDTAGLERAYDRLGAKLDAHAAKVAKYQETSLRQTDQAIRQNKRLEESHNSMASLAEGAMTAAASGVIGYVAALGSASTLISTVNAALQKQKQLGREAMESMISLSQIDASLAINLADTGKLGKSGEEARSVMREFGISDPAHIAKGIAFSLSKFYGEGERGMPTFRAAAALTQKSPDELKATAEAMGNLQAAGGFSLDQAKNLVASAGASMPTADQSQLSDYVLGSVPGAMNFADVKKHGKEKIGKQHVALAGLMMSLGLSPASAGMAATNLESDLQSLYGSDKRLKGIDPGDIFGRMDVLQGDAEGQKIIGGFVDELMEKFPTDLHGRAVSKAAATTALRGGKDDLRDKLYGQLSYEKGFADRVKLLTTGTPSLTEGTIVGQSRAGKMLRAEEREKQTGLGGIDEIFEGMQNEYYSQSPLGAWFREGGEGFELSMYRLMPSWADPGRRGYQGRVRDVARGYAGYQRGQDGNWTARPLDEFGSPGSEGRTYIEFQRDQLAKLETLINEVRKGNERPGVNPAAAADASKRQ
jgi:hypothetical protein